MKVIVIGSQEAVWGFSLAGVDGKTVRTGEELLETLDAVLADKRVGIVLVTEDVANLARRAVDQRIARSTTPLIVEIPGPGGPDPERPPLSEIIRQTIGVKI
ncbi:MAG TPA: V-type ATP synthase subunit F [Anaerolineae bacterium]|jgi:V/A-type H+-transporting ATPase subunit F|nr:V-type ATP synthase subunit F [Anaerolineae bacterium]